MHARCPSLSKVLDNDAAPCKFYCDHGMGWIRPVMEAAGLCAVLDVESRAEPHCVPRIYRDAAKTREREHQTKLPSPAPVPVPSLPAQAVDRKK